MDRDVINISFHDFQSVSSNVLMNLWNNKDSADVTLVANDGRKHLKAHKIVLSSSSSLFCDILSQCQDQNPVIFLQGINSAILEHILKFVYTGRCQIHQKDLNVFLSSGIALGVRGLADYAESGVEIGKTWKFGNNEEVLPGDFVQHNTSKELSLKNVPNAENMSLPQISTTLDDMVRVEKTVSVGHCAEGDSVISGHHTEEERVTGGHHTEGESLLVGHHAEEETFLDYHNVEEEIKSDQGGHREDQRKAQMEDGQGHSESSGSVPRTEVRGKIVRRLSCDSCGKEFRCSKSLRRHTRKHSDQTDFKCKFCDVVENNERLLICHVKSAHTQLLSCDSCDKKFRDTRGLRKHVREHLRKFSCPSCYYETNIPGNLRRHELRLHNTVREVKCYYCDVVENSERLLKCHVESAHGVRGPSFSCTECEFQSKDRATLKDHRETMHEGKTYKCDQCGFEAIHKMSLRRHIRNQHINYVRRYCNLCDFSSRKQEYVTAHKRYVHEGIRIPCDQCDKQFTRPDGLSNHKRNVHQQHRVDYACTECDFTTKSKINLSRHLEKHGTNEHSCSLCSYKTKVAQSLRAHMNREHRDQFQCDQCNYSSKQKIHLDIHVKSKHERISFTCNLCNYKASQSSNLTRHKNTKHKATDIDKADVSES